MVAPACGQIREQIHEVAVAILHFRDELRGDASAPIDLMHRIRPARYERATSASAGHTGRNDARRRNTRQAAFLHRFGRAGSCSPHDSQGAALERLGHYRATPGRSRKSKPRGRVVGNVLGVRLAARPQALPRVLGRRLVENWAVILCGC